MNRHIWGLTLFAVIVKTTVLIYWAFFAPVSFLSASISDPPAIIEVRSEPGRKCNLRKPLKADLKTVEIDVRNGYVTATVDLKNMQSVSDLPANKLRLHIFTEDMRPVWSGETTPAFIDSDVVFKKYSPDLIGLNRKVNYYAQIEMLPASGIRRESLVYEVKFATPVTLSIGKN